MGSLPCCPAHVAFAMVFVAAIAQDPWYLGPLHTLYDIPIHCYGRSVGRQPPPSPGPSSCNDCGQGALGIRQNRAASGGWLVQTLALPRESKHYRRHKGSASMICC